MTVRLGVSVEGPTEQEFCRNVIAPHLRQFHVYAEAKVAVTKRNISGPNFTGGAVSLDRVVKEIRPLLHSFDYVSTLYDYYRFRGRKEGEGPDQLCQRIADRLGNPRTLIPYVQVFEFEGATLLSTRGRWKALRFYGNHPRDAEHSAHGLSA